jgi:hypothetical protein
MDWCFLPNYLSITLFKYYYTYLNATGNRLFAGNEIACAIVGTVSGVATNCEYRCANLDVACWRPYALLKVAT